MSVVMMLGEMAMIMVEARAGGKKREDLVPHEGLLSYDPESREHFR